MGLPRLPMTISSGLFARSRTGLTTAILEGVARSSRFVLSPSQSAAAFYDDGAERIQIVTGLPDSPKVVRELTTAGGFGPVTALAVSDDGGRVLAGAGLSLWIFDEATGLSSITPDGQITALCFRSDSRDGFLALQSGQILKLSGSAGLLSLGTAAGSNDASPIAMRVSSDGTRGYIALNNGTFSVVDFRAGTAATLSCHCTPDGLEPLGLSGVFRINESSIDAPLLLLDVSRDTPRLWFVPASKDDGEGNSR